MPVAHLDRFACHYRIDGADELPVLMLVHSLGLDLGMWDAQVAALAPHVRILRYDLRGHGASGVPEGDYTIDQLGADALALADALEIRQFAFCGLSIGGMVGQWLAVNAPARLTSLVLANTSPRVADPAAFETRRKVVLDAGLAAIADVAMGRFFSPDFLARNSPSVQWARRTLLANNPVGYAGCCAAVRDMDQTSTVGGVRVPTLVVSGDQDISMPWEEHGAVLARSIAGAHVVRLPAAHISNLERPRSFTSALAAFLLPAPTDRLETGRALRRAVLGDKHVDRAIQSTTDFTRAFQELVTTYAWGTIWVRPGLDRRTRRQLVLAITASLGRWEEFRLHLSSGLDDDLEWCDVEEVLLQVAVYAGLPAANTAFHTAADERSKRGQG